MWLRSLPLRLLDSLLDDFIHSDTCHNPFHSSFLPGVLYSCTCSLRSRPQCDTRREPISVIRCASLIILKSEQNAEELRLPVTRSVGITRHSHVKRCRHLIIHFATAFRQPWGPKRWKYSRPTIVEFSHSKAGTSLIMPSNNGGLCALGHYNNFRDVWTVS